MKKRNCRGETLVETMVAILIVTLSSLLFLRLTLTSGKLNQTAQQSDRSDSSQLTAAEEGGGDQLGTVAVAADGRTYTYSVTYTGGGKALTSYAWTGAAPEAEP